MEKEQQGQALEYFSQNAKGWFEKAQSKDESKVNVIQLRINAAIDEIKKKNHLKTLLDIGCGTGELAILADEVGLDTEGIDFSREMIDIAVKNVSALPNNRSKFICASAFDHDYNADGYDVITALGFIEYISLTQLYELFDIVHRKLKSRGSFIFSSRNRLFNAISFNSYTENEIQNNEISQLLNESTYYIQGGQVDNIKNGIDICELKENQFETESRIGVSKRNQYTPGQLVLCLEKRGFRFKSIVPINIHGIPPAFKDKYPRIHAEISKMLSSFKEDSNLFLPYASTFVLHVEKN